MMINKRGGERLAAIGDGCLVEAALLYIADNQTVSLHPIESWFTIGCVLPLGHLIIYN